MIARLLIAAAVLAGLAGTADAGWRCNRSYQTITSAYGWNHSCYSCHKRKSQAYDWRQDMTRIAARKSDNEEFGKALALLVGAQYQPGQIVTSGYSGAYSTNTYNELQSYYTPQGATTYGVQGYSNDPLVDLNAVIQGQRQLAQQLAVGAQQSASDTADITSTAYQLENDRQIKIAQLAAIAGIGEKQPPQPAQTIFRQQVSQNPVAVGAVAEVATQAEMTGGLSEEFVKVVNNKCAACHTGQGNGVAKLDLDKELTENQLKAMANAVDEGTMPLKPDGQAEKLPLELRALFSAAAYPHK